MRHGVHTHGVHLSISPSTKPGQLQIRVFVSLTKVIPQGLGCTEEIADYLRGRLGPV
jgi:hypothetical protein